MWFARPDEAGGWCVVLKNAPPGMPNPAIAHFVHEQCAVHVAAIHNDALRPLSPRPSQVPVIEYVTTWAETYARISWSRARRTWCRLVYCPLTHHQFKVGMGFRCLNCGKQARLHESR